MANYQSIFDLIAAQAEQHPDVAAIVTPDKKIITYGRLRQHVQDFVAQLNYFGVGRNDPVAVVLPNGPEMAIAFLSTASGATCAPLNPAYQAPEFEFFLSDLGAKALVTLEGAGAAQVVAANRLHIPIILLEQSSGDWNRSITLSGVSQPLSAPAGLAQADDVALVLHTSGTTSRPKIVPLTHRNLITSAFNISQALQLETSDRCLNVMPLFHIHGLMAALLASLSVGASVICTPGFYAPQFFDWLDEHQPTWYTAVPSMHQAVLARADAHQDVLKRAALRFVRSSSSALPPQVMQDLEDTFHAPVIEAYGMTEASHQMASNPLPPEIRKPGSVGKAAGPEVAIMSEDGSNLLPSGAVGEIVIRGPNMTLGYANNAAANEEAFVDGWFRTGDQGYVDQEGYLYITGRIKEIINRGGEKIAPREIDEVLLEHPAVAQALAFAIEDDSLGEDVAVAIVFHPDMSATEQDIRRFVSSRLAPFKVPRLVIILDEIPKGPTGKLQRIGLADKLGISHSLETRPDEPVVHVTPETETEAWLFELWKDILEAQTFGVDHRFHDVGGDSILATKLAMRIRQDMDIEFPLVEFFEAPTIRQQASLIEKWKR